MLFLSISHQAAWVFACHFGCTAENSSRKQHCDCTEAALNPMLATPNAEDSSLFLLVSMLKLKKNNVQQTSFPPSGWNWWIVCVHRNCLLHFSGPKCSPTQTSPVTLFLQIKGSETTICAPSCCCCSDGFAPQFVLDTSSKLKTWACCKHKNKNS